MSDTAGDGRSRRGFLSKTAVTTVGLAGLSGCIGSNGGGGQSTTTFEGTVVEVGPGGQYTFSPGTSEPLRIPTGTTVTFVWRSDTHNIVVGSQPAAANWTGTPGGAAETYDEGYTYEHTFDVAGDYHYWCQPHKGLGMVADVTVE